MAVNEKSESGYLMPRAYVGFFRVTRHKMFVGVRNGERLTVLLSPVKKTYLPVS